MFLWIFLIIMDEMKQEINSKLEFCETDHDKTVADIIYDEKLEDGEFLYEMIISYKNILSKNSDNEVKNTHKLSVFSKKRKRTFFDFIKEKLSVSLK